MNRKQIIDRGAARALEQKALLVALSDDLALPLLQIKTSLEVLEAANYKRADVQKQAHLMSLSAESGLYLTEAYRLVLQAERLHDLPLEPIAIGSILDEIAHQITPYAKEYATELQVDVQGKLTPVLAHAPSLTAALQCLSLSLIRAQAAQTQAKKYHVILGAHRAHGGVIAAGTFTDVVGLSDRTLRAARSLVGHARQPLPALPSGAASGVLIADMLCATLWQPLRSAAHRNMGGLAVAVPISKQLQFV